MDKFKVGDRVVLSSSSGVILDDTPLADIPFAVIKKIDIHNNCCDIEWHTKDNISYGGVGISLKNIEYCPYVDFLNKIEDRMNKFKTGDIVRHILYESWEGVITGFNIDGDPRILWNHKKNNSPGDCHCGHHIKLHNYSDFMDKIKDRLLG